MEETKALPHRLSVEECGKLTMTGASEVCRFEEDQVEVVTSRGNVTVLGSELKLRCLSLEEGTLVIQGKITGILYDEPVKRRGLFR